MTLTRNSIGWQTEDFCRSIDTTKSSKTHISVYYYFIQTSLKTRIRNRTASITDDIDDTIPSPPSLCVITEAITPFTSSTGSNKIKLPQDGVIDQEILNQYCINIFY